MLRLSLPLAANDPPGRWTIAAAELLSGLSGEASFAAPPVGACGAMAGATPRAVFFPGERENAFRFFRTHHDVTLIVGAKEFHAAAARRLTESLRPWGVRCATVSAASVNRPREIAADEAPTWVGLEFGRVKAGRDNAIGHAGFDVRGPVVLLGAPDDHPLIEYLLRQRYLPYAPEADVFPGRGRGMIAWQRDAVGPGQESIALLAHDAVGMAEAVGTVFEMASGIEPLTLWDTPEASSLRPASVAGALGRLRIETAVVLPDRAAAIQRIAADRCGVLTWDGTLVDLDASGGIVAQREIPPGEIAKTAQRMKNAPDAASSAFIAAAKQRAAKTRIVKFAVREGGRQGDRPGERTAIGYWGGRVEICTGTGRPVAAIELPQDLTGLAWFGDRLAAGLADGRIVWLKQ